MCPITLVQWQRARPLQEVIRIQWGHKGTALLDMPRGLETFLRDAACSLYLMRTQWGSVCSKAGSGVSPLSTNNHTLILDFSGSRTTKQRKKLLFWFPSQRYFVIAAWAKKYTQMLFTEIGQLITLCYIYMVMIYLAPHIRYQNLSNEEWKLLTLWYFILQSLNVFPKNKDLLYSHKNILQHWEIGSRVLHMLTKHSITKLQSRNLLFFSHHRTLQNCLHWPCNWDHSASTSLVAGSRDMRHYVWL